MRGPLRSRRCGAGRTRQPPLPPAVLPAAALRAEEEAECVDGEAPTAAVPSKPVPTRRLKTDPANPCDAQPALGGRERAMEGWRDALGLVGNGLNGHDGVVS